jgi:transposase
LNFFSQIENSPHLLAETKILLLSIPNLLIIMYQEYSELFKRAVVRFYQSALMPVRMLARYFCISVQSIYRWARPYLVNAGILPPPPPPSSPAPVRRGRKQKLTAAAQQQIVRTVKTSKTINWSRLHLMLERKFHVRVHRSTVYRLLAQHQLTYKKAHFRGKRPDAVKMRTFKAAIDAVPASSLISLDEASFDTHMTPLYGWSTKGTKCIFYPRHSKRARKRYSLLLAICNERVLAWQLVVGAYNKQLFLSFLRERLFPGLVDAPAARHLLMDNVAFHHSKEVVALLREHDLPPPIFNPPYHPDTNPVEMAFSMMKRRARLVQPSSLQEVEQVVRDSIAQDLHPEFLRRVFTHALPFAGA